MTRSHKKGSISEEDISTVLQRYTATTVLSLLQEIAQFQYVNIDWKELVKKSTTGISNSREYQMLWRHLAYRDSLLLNFDDGAQPLDDDSELEYELEALPTVSTEASTEAAACVKVLIASAMSNDSGQPNGSSIEAPLTIDIPNSQSAPSPEKSRVTNIMVPVTVQKQQSIEGLDSNGSAGGNLPPKRKRKMWSEKEDEGLIAAVQKCGEGNWANILKGDLKIDRTASQLSQRWAIIRRKGNKGNGNLSSSQLSEVQLATRRAMSIALNTPMSKDNSRPSSAFSSTSSSIVEKASPVIPQAQHLSSSEQDSTVMVKAASVAAGARIATASDAASLLKAAHAKNAVHIMPAGGPHPNLHFICSGLAPPLSATRPSGSQPVQVHGIKPCRPKVQPNVTNTEPISAPKVQDDHKPSVLSNVVKDQMISANSENKGRGDATTCVSQQDTIKLESIKDDKQSLGLDTCGVQSVNSEKLEVQNGIDEKAETAAKLSASLE